MTIHEELMTYKKEYLSLPCKTNLKDKEALAKVEQNGYALQYVEEQTEAICLAAVKQDGCALRYVREQMFN